MATKKETIIKIKDGLADVTLGTGWPTGAEAAKETQSILKGFDITVKAHRPHSHQDESVKNEVRA